MPTPAAVWLVIGFAAVAAHLPFVSERLFVVGPRRDPKGLGGRLREAVAFGGGTLAVGTGPEARLGPVRARRWEFHAGAGGRLPTLAFPGSVWRHLRRRG